MDYKTGINETMNEPYDNLISLESEEVINDETNNEDINKHFMETGENQEIKVVKLIPDYAQNSLWFNALENVPGIKKLFGLLSQGVAINNGGIFHRGSRTYTLHSLGFLYCIVWILLIVADIELL